MKHLPPGKQKPVAPSRTATHEVRIVGGQWKRTRLPVLDRPGLRPTPDRVRETLFNWLGQDLSGCRVLDAFAGTGALGFEAASRGAEAVWMIDKDPVLVKNLQAVKARLQATGIELLQADALVWMKQASARATASAAANTRFDLILLDPPFAADLFEAALAVAPGLLNTDGQVYLETDRSWPVGALAAGGWDLIRHHRFGQVHAHLLKRAAPAVEPQAQSTEPVDAAQRRLS